MRKILITLALLVGILFQSVHAKNINTNLKSENPIIGYPEYESINNKLTLHFKRKKNKLSEEKYIEYINILGKQIYVIHEDNIRDEIETKKHRIIAILSYLISNEVFKYDFKEIQRELKLEDIF